MKYWPQGIASSKRGLPSLRLAERPVQRLKDTSIFAISCLIFRSPARIPLTLSQRGSSLRLL